MFQEMSQALSGTREATHSKSCGGECAGGVPQGESGGRKVVRWLLL